MNNTDHPRAIAGESRHPPADGRAAIAKETHQNHWRYVGTFNCAEWALSIARYGQLNLAPDSSKA